MKVSKIKKRETNEKKVNKQQEKTKQKKTEKRKHKTKKNYDKNDVGESQENGSHPEGVENCVRRDSDVSSAGFFFRILFFILLFFPHLCAHPSFPLSNRSAFYMKTHSLFFFLVFFLFLFFLQMILGYWRRKWKEKIRSWQKYSSSASD